jgi:hypothetical protein
LDSDAFGLPYEREESKRRGCLGVVWVVARLNFLLYLMRTELRVQPETVARRRSDQKGEDAANHFSSLN